MTASDQFAFQQGLRRLQTTFGKDLSTDRASGFWAALEDLDLPAVLHGMTEAAKSERFFPPPAVIRTHALRYQADTARQAVAHVNLDAGECYCTACDDTGWEMVSQYAAIDQHEIQVARRCSCRPSNPVYRANVARQSVAARRDV